MSFAATDGLQVKSEDCYVLYDQTDGTIRHIHQVVVMEGAEEVPLEDRAFELARQYGVDTAKLACLRVDARTIDSRITYKVDVKKRCLLETGDREGTVDR